MVCEASDLETTVRGIDTYFVVIYRNMGSYNADRSADLDYPLAFVESMGRVLQSMTARPPFRYVQLSGKWARSDQGQRLWWGEDARKLKVGKKSCICRLGNV